jgi:hypothetical protein
MEELYTIIGKMYVEIINMQKYIELLRSQNSSKEESNKNN